jgi:hypothetical protein
MVKVFLPFWKEKGAVVDIFATTKNINHGPSSDEFQIIPSIQQPPTPPA